MGSYSSKACQEKKQDKFQSFTSSVKSKLDEELTRRMMIQREVQMAVNIARARDNIYIFGSVYLAFVSSLTMAKIMKRNIPGFVLIPVVGGGIALGNLIDMAYGNKLARINKEAEHIISNERARLVPFRQAPMARFYSDDERSIFYDHATAVGDMPPYNTITRSFAPHENEKEA